MYKLSFDLEPLTYMVHFQKDDANATIRASELKPMFDRYLTEVIRNPKNMLNKVDYPILESYSEDEAVDESDYLHFDYQVRVELQNGRPNTSHKDSNREFFFKEDLRINGKQLYKDGKKVKVDKFSLISTYPKVTFLTRHATLSMLIQKYFEYFVAISFFGFRKGKGYGQFRVINGQIIEGKEKDRKTLIKDTYESIGIDPIIFDIPHQKNNIDSVIQFINESNRVLKSILLENFVTENPLEFKWDKELIASRIRNLNNNNVTPNNTRFLRLLFGLSGQYGKYNKIENSQIDRFENPVKYFVSYSDRANSQKYLHVVIEKHKLEKLLETVGNSEFSFSRVEKNKICNNPKEFRIRAVKNQQVGSKDGFKLDELIKYIKNNLGTMELPVTQNGYSNKYHEKMSHSNQPTRKKKKRQPENQSKNLAFAALNLDEKWNMGNKNDK